MRICIIRHGEAQDDVDDCYGGIADFTLTDLGRSQAAETAEIFRNENPNAIYSSPLKRASETAEIIADRLRLAKPSVVEGLQERNSYGVLSGVNKDQAKVVFANVLSKLTEKPGYSKEPIPGCELWDDFVVRVRTTFDSVIEDSQKNGFESIGIVTHGKFTSALFDDVLKIEGPIDLKLSAINILDYQSMTASLSK